MNDRKQHVVKMAHQLFIDKGFQATSIQDILDYSGISKGTFYNYFSSKSELMIAIFKMTYADLEKQRNELLIGQDRTDIEIFIKQIELQLKTNRKNKLITLFEEVLVSNDIDLKQFIDQGRINNIRWIYERLLDIFGETKKPYLLDCAIMFMGLLRDNIKFFHIAHDTNANIGQVVRYSVRRLVNLVDELAETDEQLIQPEQLESWLPDCRKPDQIFQKKLHHSIYMMKNLLRHNEEQSKYMELLDFIEEELLDSKSPRKFLIESALLSLKAVDGSVWEKEWEPLEKLVEDFFKSEDEK
ncbi:TetR/AcrR family transcriptional regulator [Neobacillus sp.]|uniref:TetR/AcrR family transcriptional regulator n=1 Tax=Neobacillus sp. TaxID=2675273 RepID=UPI00289C754F|nr:TetR/AcrR family transcriptional regulator [Neobacillus sp.]